MRDREFKEIMSHILMIEHVLSGYTGIKTETMQKILDEVREQIKNVDKV